MKANEAMRPGIKVLQNDRSMSCGISLENRDDRIKMLLLLFAVAIFLHALSLDLLFLT